MRILVSDYNKKRLDELSEYIKEFYPDDELIVETDSLMTAKRCFFEAFDVVFANLDDRRLDGVKMKDFVRHCSFDAKYFICGNLRDLCDWNVIDESGNICEEGVDGAIAYPVTKEKIMKALNKWNISAAGSNDSGMMLDDEMLGFAAGGCDSSAADTLLKNSSE